jgi:hypothetical protein
LNDVKLDRLVATFRVSRVVAVTSIVCLAIGGFFYYFFLYNK